MPGNLCEHCVGYCCRHIALPIETPNEVSDFDDLRWYVLHEGVSIFVEDGDWYLYVDTVCRHLQSDFRCGIYETRPQICRDYSTENCDYHSGDYGWEEHFTCGEHIEEYVERRFGKALKTVGKKWKKREKQVMGQAQNDTNGESSTTGNSGTRGKKQRLKIKLGARRAPKDPGAVFSTLETDRYGVPLPVLGSEPTSRG